MLEGKSAFVLLAAIVAIITFFIVKIRQSMDQFDEEEAEKREVLRERVRTKDDYLIVDDTGKTLLMQAVTQGFREGVELILAQAGPEAINFATEDGTTALHYAAATGDAQIVSRLLSGGALPDAGDTMARTPLWLAAQRENARIVEVLLEYGANINVQAGREHMTPLMVAALYSRIDVVNMLLDNGADATLLSNEGKTAALYAQENLGRNMGVNVAANQRMTEMVLRLESAASGASVLDRLPWEQNDPEEDIFSTTPARKES